MTVSTLAATITHFKSWRLKPYDDTGPISFQSTALKQSKVHYLIP